MNNIGYRVLLLSCFRKIKTRNNSLVIITDEDNEITIYIKDISVIIIDNLQSVITTHVIDKLTKENVVIIICDEKHNPSTIINNLGSHHQLSKNISNQLKWSKERKYLIHKNIIKNKIINSIFVVRSVNKNFDFEERINKLNFDYNIEGAVASMYFKEIFGKDFKRRDEFNNVNSYLNYGYAIIRSMMIKIVVAKGLLPSEGIFHKNQFNNFNLADDFMEPYRAIVDLITLKHFNYSEEMTSTDKKEMIQHITEYTVTLKNKKHTILNSMSLYVDSIIKYMENSEGYEPLLLLDE